MKKEKPMTALEAARLLAQVDELGRDPIKRKRVLDAISRWGSGEPPLIPRIPMIRVMLDELKDLRGKSTPKL